MYLKAIECMSILYKHILAHDIFVYSLNCKKDLCLNKITVFWHLSSPSTVYAHVGVCVVQAKEELVFVFCFPWDDSAS